MHTHSYDVVQVPFYLKNENTGNHCMFQSKVKWGSELVSSPPTAHTQCFLSSVPSSTSRSCVSGVPDTTGSCGLLRAPRKVPAFPLSYGPANSTHFCYPLEIAPMFFWLKSPSPSPARAGTAPLASLPVFWIPQRYNFVLELWLWLPGYNFWAQVKMTAMIVKGQLYLKDHTIFCVKDHAICGTLTILRR